ncbi:hemerythrin domain-containing protein [Paenibacillus glycanilyticus]|uniref:hemerythrin domain-containing protein n=1 Tax=Paenibacillus glycanilyticus TaxID=126569 RepID=UPI00203AF337|nr:hemerythrin domain-containing protein [Paenibacillus glycanilyticus]MCM3630448.1 hemerythrin domain-containing protein [Paenibacillus glycanilyticus]
MKLDPLNTARPSAFVELAMRLEADHEQIKAMCSALCQQSIHHATGMSSYVTIQGLIELRQEAEALLGELQRHSQWEEDELFPVLMHYSHKKIEPTIMPSLWVLEKDHELAVLYIESFIRASSTLLHAWRLEPISGADLQSGLKEGCDCLTQGCFILTAHFQMEEELLFPLAEEILTDMDYLFS